MSYDDRYAMRYDDDYDDIDDEYPEPRRPSGYVGDAETLLRRAVDIVATAPTMPLSSSPRIDRDEIIELLEEALARLPDELRQARWMLKERQEFVAKTRREADELLEAARVQAERMVQRTEVVRAAEQRARQVMETADSDSRRLTPRDRGLPRPASRQLRDPARQAVEDRRTPDARRLSIGAIRDETDRHRRGRPDQGLLRPGRLMTHVPAAGSVTSMVDIARQPSTRVELLRQPGTSRRFDLAVDARPSASVATPR